MKRYTRYIRNLSLLTLALVISLALVGVGYAHWTDSLHIDGKVKVSACYVELAQQETNDPVDHWYDYHDPKVQGADESIAPGFAGNPWRLWKDVGWTDCELLDTDDDTLRDTCVFTVNNAYPCYFGKLILRVSNQSESAWIQVDSVDVIYGDPNDPSDPEHAFDFSSPPIMSPPWPHPAGFEVQWTNGAWNLPIKIPPGQITHLGCDVHVLQLPDNQDTTYDFQIQFHFTGPVNP